MTEHNIEDVFDDAIDLKSLFKIIWDKKIFFASLTSAAAILSVIYALSLPNIYTSSTLLAPKGI
jgi:uncharacterized protein involved in exopolysaccharide biosynthesis